MPFVVASQISPSGMTLAGKYGIGIISLGSMSTQGLMALPTQWGFAEDAAKKAGTTVSRADWRVLLSWHIAETREQAQREAGPGLMRWHNEYTVRTLQRPGVEPFKSPEDAVEKTAGGENAASTIGTPDDLVKTIKNLINVSGGVGTIIGFVHDWANPENTRRSWDMVARYVIPEINGYVAKLRESQKFLIENRAVFERAGAGRDGQDHGKRKGRRGAAAHRPRPGGDPDHQRAGPAEGSGQAQGVMVSVGAMSSPRHCEERSDEAIHLSTQRKWIASRLGAHARNDGVRSSRRYFARPTSRNISCTVSHATFCRNVAVGASMPASIAVADRRASGQRRKHHAGRQIGAGERRMALVRRIEIEFGLLADRAWRTRGPRESPARCCRCRRLV